MGPFMKLRDLNVSNRKLMKTIHWIHIESAKEQLSNKSAVNITSFLQLALLFEPFFIVATSKTNKLLDFLFYNY